MLPKRFAVNTRLNKCERLKTLLLSQSGESNCSRKAAIALKCRGPDSIGSSDFDRSYIGRVILIMGDLAAEAKLRFLYASAHLYSVTAPATSAQLMLQQQNEIAGNTGPKRNHWPSSSCKACGTVLIPGRTSRTSRIDKGATRMADIQPKKPPSRKKSPNKEKFVRVKCLACHRFEDTALPRSKTTNDSRSAKTTSQPTSSSDFKANLDPESSPLDRPTKANRRRERARRNKNGLQALLEKSKAQATHSPGFGLDLLDLMKQS